MNRDPEKQEKPETTDPILSTAADLLVTNDVNADDPAPLRQSTGTNHDPDETSVTEMTDDALAPPLPTLTDMSQARSLVPQLGVRLSILLPTQSSYLTKLVSRTLVNGGE
jgi:hypothetical protein